MVILTIIIELDNFYQLSSFYRLSDKRQKWKLICDTDCPGLSKGSTPIPYSIMELQEEKKIKSYFQDKISMTMSKKNFITKAK